MPESNPLGIVLLCPECKLPGDQCSCDPTEPRSVEAYIPLETVPREVIEELRSEHLELNKMHQRSSVEEDREVIESTAEELPDEEPTPPPIPAPPEERPEPDDPNDPLAQEGWG